MIFFGTSNFSIIVLERLLELGIKPSYIVTVPDRPQGRKMLITPPPIKVWAEAHNINVLQFEKLNDDAVVALKNISGSTVNDTDTDMYVVASYGKIIPQKVLDIPTFGTLNIHPSLLPKYRGATPLQTTILNDDSDIGVTIIQMDKEMDHGPIVATRAVSTENWPLGFFEIENILALVGADMLAETIPLYVEAIKNKSSDFFADQNHSLATFTKKITREDGLIDIDGTLAGLESELTGDKGWNNFLKYKALEDWPQLYFFIDRNSAYASSINEIETPNKQKMRVKIKTAEWDAKENKMQITLLTPEGKKDMHWKDFLNFIESSNA